MTHKLFAVAALAAVLASPAASAQVAMTSLGTLICSVGPSTKSESAAVVANHNVICLFIANDSGPQESYTGTLLTAGLSDELAGRPVVIWAVLGPRSATDNAGMLAQKFSGSAADADGAKGPLVGDANISVVLHLATKTDAIQQGKPSTASIELTLVSTAG